MIADDARVEPEATIGLRTNVWHLVHVRAGATIGSGCVIGGGAFIDGGVTIGDNCKIQNGAQIFAPARIENGVFIGPGAILTNDRRPRAVNPDLTPKSASDWQAAGVTVGAGASIGAGAIIVAGITIGKWALVAAGAVVTRDVRAHELVAGVPAEPVGWIGRDGMRLELHDGRWTGSDGAVFELTMNGLEEVTP